MFVLSIIPTELTPIKTFKEYIFKVVEQNEKYEEAHVISKPYPGPFPELYLGFASPEGWWGIKLMDLKSSFTYHPFEEKELNLSGEDARPPDHMIIKIFYLMFGIAAKTGQMKRLERLMMRSLN
jgi:hypothetical protein